MDQSEFHRGRVAKYKTACFNVTFDTVSKYININKRG